MQRALFGFLFLVGLLAARSPAAFAYEVKTTSSGALISWPEGDIDVVLDLGARPNGIAVADAEGAVLGAFAAWSRRIEDSVSLRFSSHQGKPLVHEPADGQNLVNWIVKDWEREYAPSALAVTRVTYKIESGAIFEADIAVNADRHEWTASEDDDADCSDAYDLQNVTAHEVGHFLGLGHADEEPAATMFPKSARCETQKRELAADDIAGLGVLYEGAADDASRESDAPGEPPDAREPVTFGCSAAGRSAGAAGAHAALGLVLAFGFLLRRRRVGALAFLAAAVALPSTAGATAARQMDVGELASRSAAVVRGEVISQRTFRRGGMIYTDSTLRVTACWRGTCPDEVVVRQLGGEHGEVGMIVEGQAPLARGDRLVLFLRRRGDGALAPVGLAQGAFREVKGDGGSPTLVRDLRELSLVSGSERSRGQLERWDPAELRRQVAASSRD